MYKLIFEPTGRTNEIDINKYMKIGTRPSIPSAEEIVNSIKLGDGTTHYDHTGIYSDRKIKLDCNFIARSKSEWIEHCRVIQEYFKGGKGRLYLPNENDATYWIVKNISLSIDERWHGYATRLTVEFTVDPYRYLIEYEKSETYPTHAVYNISFYNFYEASKPIFRLYYESNITEFSVVRNGSYSNTFTIDDPFTDLTPLYIDIDVEECVLRYVYQNGTTETHTEKTTGDFDNLVIPSGNSTFEITSDYVCEIEIYRRYRKL